jgi:hypothetical protein
MQNFILKLLLVAVYTFTSAQSSAQNVQIDNRLVQIARSRVNTDKNLHRFKYVRSYIELESARLEAWFQNSAPRKIKLKIIPILAHLVTAHSRMSRSIF